MHNITLKTLPSATLQQVFEQVAVHLLTQNKTSKKLSEEDSRLICVYLNPEGLKCAAGCFISEEEYSPSFEGKAWEYLREEREVPNNHSKFISKLQRLHDEKPTHEWKNALEDLGKRHDLDISFLNNL